MSNQRGDGDGALLLLVAAVVLIGLAVWKFSAAFGLDMPTGGSVLLRLVLVAVVAGISLKIYDFDDIFGFKNIWPLLLALLWVCWWPAFDYWANQQYPTLWAGEETTIWWNAWYTKAAEFFGSLAVGYGVKRCF